MAKQLDLSDEQKTKVEALFEEQDAQRAEQLKLQREKRQQVMDDRESRREAMEKAREQAIEENDAKLESIIGKEKMGQWKSYREDVRKRMQDANRSGRRTPRRNIPKAVN
jgi:Spy/CpxP family protein refolding chaperone